jgi:murein DD-endopeptidase MepM/ murein hydrolase activator NlpD
MATNDYYAVDFIRAERHNGHGKPVVAVAPGIVRLAGWSKRGFAPYGKIVYIEHDFEDRAGKRYQTLYAHLSRILVKRGQRVEAGTVIGLLGGSSKRRRQVFGSHLHFAMYRGAKPYLGGGQAVVPEPMGAQEDLHPRKRWTVCSGPEPMPVASLEGPVDAEAVGGLTDLDQPPDTDAASPPGD